jgi:hypothetical protein
MIKNMLITFLVLTNIAFGAFGYIQKVAADESRLLAERSIADAERQRALAVQNEVKAHASLIEAAHQHDLALKAEQQCALVKQKKNRK